MIRRDPTSPDEGALPSGKLPPALLRTLLAALPTGQDVLVGPGVGRDVAVVEAGGARFALKSDPITFVSDRLGWYAIHVNANDLAAAGAEPRWFLATLLLPERRTDPALVERIIGDIAETAKQIGAAVVGGHTEITRAVVQPVLAGTMIGVIEGDPVRSDGLRPGDRVLLTKGMAIEATAIIAREMPERLRAAGLTSQEIEAGAKYLTNPGISVIEDARIARRAGAVHAMHDPTEGGIVTALDELAEASQVGLDVNREALIEALTPLTKKVCRAVGIDPRGAISSGALLIGVGPDTFDAVEQSLRAAGIGAFRLAAATDRHDGCGFADCPAADWPHFARDEIARLYEEMA